MTSRHDQAMIDVGADALLHVHGETATLIPQTGVRAERTVLIDRQQEQSDQRNSGSAAAREIIISDLRSRSPQAQRGERWIVEGDTWSIERFDEDQSDDVWRVMRCTRVERREIAHEGRRQRSFR